MENINNNNNSTYQEQYNSRLYDVNRYSAI